jgi:hypothetical protein
MTFNIAFLKTNKNTDKEEHNKEEHEDDDNKEEEHDDEEEDEDDQEEHNEDVNQKPNRNVKKIDYIWESLSNIWQTKLMSEKFYIKNCLADDNCKYRSIESALINAGYKTNNVKLRKMIGKHIYKLELKDFFTIIENYRVEKSIGEYIGEWDPYSIKNKKEFINEIKKPTFHFCSDFTTLNLICKVTGIDFIILKDDYTINNISDVDNLNTRMIILYNIKDKNEFQAMGLKIRTKIQSIFKRQLLPKELSILTDKQSFLLQHIKLICENDIQCENIQLNSILKTLENNLQTKLKTQAKKQSLGIIKLWLDNSNFFKNKT